MAPLDLVGFHRALRERLTRVLGGGASGGPVVRERATVDVIVTHIEVNERHGTGVLLKRLFGGSPDILSVRSRDLYGGEQTLGAHALLVSHPDASRPMAFSRVLAAFRGFDVRRILCVPYYPDDALTALALRESHGAPLCTFVMDDQNIHAAGIPDELMRELLERSDLRLAISSELRDAYQEKFGQRIWFQPPTVQPGLIQRVPHVPSDQALAGARGAILGNIWGGHWLQRLREVTREAGVALDWYSNAGSPWMRLKADELAADGIHLRGSPPDGELVRLLRETPFVVVASGTGDAERDTHRFIARLSLPSKIPFIMATSNTPILVVGQAGDCAARFVTAQGIGLAIPYDARRLQEAVRDLRQASTQARMRARAAELAPAFSCEGARDWIWRSLLARAPVDEAWERLAARAVAVVPARPDPALP